MPTRTLTFLQPYDSETPEPTRHEWRFLPVAPDGRGPTEESSVPTVEVLSTGEMCDAEDLWQFCTDELTTIHSSGRTIPPTSEELNECILNNTSRCIRSSVTYAPDDGWVLVRACGDVEGFTCSVWSLGSPVPEPGVSLALLVGSLALVAIARLRSLRG